MHSEDGVFSVRLVQNTAGEERWFFFLPAGMDADSAVLDLPSHMTISFNGASYQNGDTPRLSPGSFFPGFEVHYRGKCILSSSLEILQAQNTPSLFLSVIGDGSFEKVREDPTKKTVIPVAYQSVAADGLPDASGQCTFGGRGNVTWRIVQTKKPYKMTLSTPASFFGMNAATKWTLLANYYDDTCLRNHIAFETARRLNCEDTPDDTFVNLYVDGAYQGLYQMTQKPDMDGGSIRVFRGENYHLEFNTEGWVNEDVMTYDSSLKLISLNYPSVLRSDQWERLTRNIDETEASLTKNDDYRTFIDEASFVKQFLIHEAYLNKDVDFSSQFIVQKSPDPLWYAGPLWDFDRSFGADEMKLSYNGIETQVMWIEGMTRGGSVDSGWYKALYDNPVFHASVKTYYTDTFSRVFGEMTGLVPLWEKEIKTSVAMDHALYGYALDDHTKACARITNWMEERRAFLDAFWKNEEPYICVTFLSAQDEDNWHDMHYYCLPETPIEQFPDGNGIVGWKTEDGEEVRPGVSFSTDVRLYPLYETNSPNE